MLLVRRADASLRTFQTQLNGRSRDELRRAGQLDLVDRHARQEDDKLCCDCELLDALGDVAARLGGKSTRRLLLVIATPGRGPR